MDFYDSNGEVNAFAGVAGMHEIIEQGLGQVTATYTPPNGGAAFPVPGILKSRRQDTEELSAELGRINYDVRYKVRRAVRDTDAFPADTGGNGFGTLAVAGKTRRVVAVESGRSSWVLLFLSTPIV